MQKEIVIERNTWLYLCARLGTYSKNLCAAIGLPSLCHKRDKKLKAPAILCLAYYCRLRRLELNNLLREASHVYHTSHLAQIFGVTNKVVKDFVTRNKTIKLVTRRPYIFVNRQDLMTIVGFREIAELYKQNPFWVWRQKNKVSLRKAANLFQVDYRQVLAWELGKNPPDNEILEALLSICGKEVTETLLVWHSNFKKLFLHSEL
ncbi:MAG: helix-turn-helix transcriptional regulator [Acidobacteria bacterium]|nr:helix-turn-helix transcriptional regulator [Acidobacteriota bacterium]